MLLSLPISLLAAPQWYSLGLDDRAVHCILADDISAIIAGTDSGISVYYNEKWYHIAMLPGPAMSIVRVSSGVVAVAAGNNPMSSAEWSDGVYIGTIAAGTPPFYSFKVGAHFASPTALLASETLSASDPAVMHLYVANGNSVAAGAMVNDSLSKLNPIGMPDYAFGIEQPYCTALHIFSNRLYAGGYDKSPMAGSSYLEYMYADSMYPMRAMKTTAITEGRFSSILGSGSLVMAVADADSGVFFYDLSMGNPWRRIAGPAGNSVRSLYVRQASGSINDNTLYAANKDGVFQCTSGGAPQPYWVKLGTLPAEPLYITCIGSSGDLLAATVKGVYRYGENGARVINAGRANAGKSVYSKKRLTVAVAGKPRAGRAGFDLRGRSIMHSSTSELLIDNVNKSGH